jgi:hypothetical protein
MVLAVALSLLPMRPPVVVLMTLPQPLVLVSLLRATGWTLALEAALLLVAGTLLLLLLVVGTLLLLLLLLLLGRKPLCQLDNTAWWHFPTKAFDYVLHLTTSDMR